MRAKWIAVPMVILTSPLAACIDRPATVLGPDVRAAAISPQGAVKFWESGASVYWNQVADDH